MDQTMLEVCRAFDKVAMARQTMTRADQTLLRATRQLETSLLQAENALEDLFRERMARTGHGVEHHK